MALLIDPIIKEEKKSIPAESLSEIKKRLEKRAVVIPQGLEIEQIPPEVLINKCVRSFIWKVDKFPNTVNRSRVRRLFFLRGDRISYLDLTIEVSIRYPSENKQGINFRECRGGLFLEGLEIKDDVEEFINGESLIFNGYRTWCKLHGIPLTPRWKLF